MIGPDELGRRVVVRHRIPDGRATDLLGELVAITADRLAVRDRDGREHVIAVSTIVAAKAVPPPPVRRVRSEPEAGEV